MMQLLPLQMFGREKRLVQIRISPLVFQLITCAQRVVCTNSLWRVGGAELQTNIQNLKIKHISGARLLQNEKLKAKL